MRNKFGFTLAEILITLGIIGVVAAMTMPTLIANHQKKQTVTQLKKAYSELNQAISVAQAEYGTMDGWDLSGFDTVKDRVEHFNKNYLLPNIKTLQVCDQSTVGECWGTSFTKDGAYSFITPSGYSVMYWIHKTGSGGWFYIDTNGPKKPNITGKDVFILMMSWGNKNPKLDADFCQDKKLGLYPYGLHCKSFNVTRENLTDGATNETGQLHGCKKDVSRANCAALIMYDGWQIKEDYPW